MNVIEAYVNKTFAFLFETNRQKFMFVDFRENYTTQKDSQ